MTAYETLPFNHDSVRHSLSESVKGDGDSNEIRLQSSTRKRAHKGTFNKLSPQQLDRYVHEFARRHNIRGPDTIGQIASISDGMKRKRLRYAQRIVDSILPSGACAQTYGR